MLLGLFLANTPPRDTGVDIWSASSEAQQRRNRSAEQRRRYRELEKQGGLGRGQTTMKCFPVMLEVSCTFYLSIAPLTGVDARGRDETRRKNSPLFHMDE